MAGKIRVGVVFGGRSGEHEVSVRSASAVIENLDREKYDVIPIGISNSGKWLSTGESSRMLPSHIQNAVPARYRSASHNAIAISTDPRRRGLVSLNDAAAKTQKLDLVLPVLHGTYGEDGTIQGLFEMADIPYAGCGVLASSCGMDKVVMKTLFREAGLPICKHVWFLRSHWEKSPEAQIRKIAAEIGFPCFVKPANLGSSVGISRATDRESLRDSIKLAATFDRKIIVEEGLDAREIECGVLGNEEPVASLPGEYVVKTESAAFLDYEEKYSKTGNVQFIVPAPISKSLTTRIQKMATRAFQSVDGSGLARVDFFLKRDTNELLINELNTLPGLTDVSGYPQMWEKTGIKFGAVLDQLISLAFERYHEKSRNRTTR